ncbi:two-component response regulator 24-like [Neltuma alba]|uniref:two-component response regulator 24-like n=1 Tax=Neltuma alba TaxID=207710 RepID=UPI0010A484C4|nr:two-component response regulator 24-like [Prosopis alba]XP_028794920.1 two-component response regulator 24-like [Prosopis alba]
MEGNSSPRRELRALVVDDQEMLRRIHERMLNSVGVTNVETVENGQEAINIHRAGRSFDLILMDLDMPIMNGIEATRGLRAMGIRSKIAGVSARSEEARLEEFMKAGIDLFLHKPLTSPDLSSLVRSINPL